MNEPWRVFETIQMGLLLIGVGVVVYSPIAKAIAKRILHGKLPSPDSPAIDDGRMDQLSGEVAALRHHLDETQERLDFTERMLAQSRDKQALPGGQ